MLKFSFLWNVIILAFWSSLNSTIDHFLPIVILVCSHLKKISSLTYCILITISLPSTPPSPSLWPPISPSSTTPFPFRKEWATYVRVIWLQLVLPIDRQGWFGRSGWLGRDPLPPSLLNVCSSWSHMIDQRGRPSLSRWGPIFGQVYMNSWDPLLQSPKKLSKKRIDLPGTSIKYSKTRFNSN